MFHNSGWQAIFEKGLKFGSPPQPCIWVLVAKSKLELSWSQPLHSCSRIYLLSNYTNSCFYLLKGSGLCEKARVWCVGFWRPLASPVNLPNCRLEYTYWEFFFTLPHNVHPESQRVLRIWPTNGWRGRTWEGVGSVHRWQEISGSNINTHTVACLHSSTDFSRLLACDTRVVISTWHTRRVFLCVCLAVSLEDIHKVY